jgi:hypothetical protein
VPSSCHYHYVFCSPCSCGYEIILNPPRSGNGGNGYVGTYNFLGSPGEGGGGGGGRRFEKDFQESECENSFQGGGGVGLDGEGTSGEVSGGGGSGGATGAWWPGDGGAYGGGGGNGRDWEAGIGGNGAIKIQYGYPELNSIAVDPTQTLQVCEGDCDRDSDCAPGLKCFERDGLAPVPGCSGTGINDYDYCVYPVLNTIGYDPRQTLQVCEGDCDRDSDCATGLKCFKRDALEPVPGCSGAGKRYQDYCVYPELNSIGVTPSQTLQVCEGDCDRDSDCAPGLKCFERDALEPVPGCRGTGINNYDYCVYPELNSIAVNPSQTLQVCEGDCDRDSDCAPGLKCFNRDALDGLAAVPGCRGTGISDYDYCVRA